MSKRTHYLLRLKDNRTISPFWNAIEPTPQEPQVREELTGLLRRFAGWTPQEFRLAGAAALHDLVAQEDDGSSTSPVFTIGGSVTEVVSLTTFNAMGVLRLRESEKLQLTLEIGSRFDPEQNQFFLNYLLHRVFGGSFTDPVDLGHSSLWELLLILVFRTRLVEAFAQGLFKRYTRFEHNDAQFRGSLNLNRYLRRNVPFVGAIAYTTHEFSHDTPVTRLIRSALWHIENKCPRLLDGSAQLVTEARQAIERNTPSWRARNLSGYFKENLSPVRHAYFSAYEPLRRVSLAVLEDEGAALYECHSDGEVDGVIFDGAWLWEHYLATLLVPMGMTHCLYPSGDGMPVFQDRSYLFFPDFYHKAKSVVLDAKYKRSPAREDFHQVLAYMYLAGAKQGGVILPPDSDAGDTSVGPLAIARRGIDSRSFWEADSEAFWHRIVFRKPQGNVPAHEFIRGMEAAEVLLQSDVATCWQGKNTERS